MIGAMPAVAVRHERRRQEKGGGSSGSHGSHHQVGLCSRPSQLYVGGVWPPPHSPCSTSPSPGGHHSPDDDRFPEYYVCGKVSALQLVVGSLLLGAIVLVVGLVQLTPGADAAENRFWLMGAGAGLIVLGLALTGLRCCCIHCPKRSKKHHIIDIDGTHSSLESHTAHHLQNVSSIDMLVKESTNTTTNNSVITSPSELDTLIKTNNHNYKYIHRGSNGHAPNVNNTNNSVGGNHHHHHKQRHSSTDNASTISGDA